MSPSISATDVPETRRMIELTWLDPSNCVGASRWLCKYASARPSMSLRLPLTSDMGSWDHYHGTPLFHRVPITFGNSRKKATSLTAPKTWGRTPFLTGHVARRPRPDRAGRSRSHHALH